MNEQFQLMLAELESSQLEVVLVPARHAVNTDAMVRVAANKNCEWYRRFCARHASSRARNNQCFDTRIRRHKTIEQLNRLIAGLPCRGFYADELTAIATKRLSSRHSNPTVINSA